MTKLSNGVETKMIAIEKTVYADSICDARYRILADGKPTNISAFYRYQSREPLSGIIAQLRFRDEYLDISDLRIAGMNEWIEARLTASPPNPRRWISRQKR